MKDNSHKQPKDQLAEFMVKKIAIEAEIESRKLLKYIAPIYRVDDDGNPEQYGTGVFLVIHDHYFLVTAAHVLDDNVDSTLYIPSNESGALVTLEGPSFKSIADDGGRSNDRTDVGVVKLKSDLIEKIGRNSFFPISATDVDDTGKKGGIYIAMGYPWILNENVDLVKNSLKRHAISYTANILPDERVVAAGVHSGSHLLIAFKKEQSHDTTGQEVTAPSPPGMSGGPLWRFDVFADHQTPSKLVGIIIEWHHILKGILAIRIPIVLAGIAHQFPDLADFIPRTGTVNISVQMPEAPPSVETH